MKTKRSNRKQTSAAQIPLGAGATLKIPTCGSCEEEVIWIGRDWYHAKKPEFTHFARLGAARTLCIPNYPTGASIAA